MTEPTILFVKPKSISPSDKTQLRKAGVTVIEIEDPSSVKFVRADHELPTNMILGAAAKAILAQDSFTNARQAFGRAMCQAIEDYVKPKA